MAIPFSNRSAEIKFSESALVGRPRLSRNCSEFIDDLKNQEEYWHCHCEAFVWLANNKIRVTFISSQHLEDYIHKGITFRGFPVEIKPISTKKWVRVHRLAYGIPNDAVIWALGSYGEITKIQNEDYRGANVGIRNVLMEITSPIPSQLRIRGHLCLISYRGQRRTCFRCGEPGHQKPDCPLNEYDNAPPRTDDPPLGDEQQHASDQEGENPFDQNETEDNPFEEHADNSNTDLHGSDNNGENDHTNNDKTSGIDIDPVIRESTQHSSVENNNSEDTGESNSDPTAANADGPSAGSQIDSSKSSDQGPAEVVVNEILGSGNDQVTVNAVANSTEYQTDSGQGVEHSTHELGSVNTAGNVELAESAECGHKPRDSTLPESIANGSGHDPPPNKVFVEPQLVVRRHRRRKASARSDLSNTDSEPSDNILKMIRTNSSASLSERHRKLAPTRRYASVVRKSTRRRTVPNVKSLSQVGSPVLIGSQSIESLESSNV